MALDSDIAIAPYEAPEKPEIHLHSDQQSLEEEVNEILAMLRDRGIINQ